MDNNEIEIQAIKDAICLVIILFLLIGLGIFITGLVKQKNIKIENEKYIITEWEKDFGR